MKLDDVVEVNLVDRSPKETYRPVREMAAKIITEDVKIRIYNGASREILKNMIMRFFCFAEHIPIVSRLFTGTKQDSCCITSASKTDAFSGREIRARSKR